MMTNKMNFSCFGFLLLIWFPEAVNARSGEAHCSAPNLDGGFFVPERSIYPHGTKLTYACDTGNKPAVEGWWVTSICQNNKWSPEPKCIDERYCLPPNIPNSNYETNAAGWYEETKIRITCDEGYMSRDGDATAECKNGTWTSIPICEKSRDACDEPPNMPHAVIIQRHQTLFGVDSKVLYKCEDGYVVEGRDEETFINCISGNWTASQPCRVSTGSVRDPSGTRPSKTTIDKCGELPTLANGVVTYNRRSLTYQCNNYYKLVGSAQVVCFSDGSWSNLPTCEEAFCIVNTAENPKLQQLSEVKYLMEGTGDDFNCLVTDYLNRPYLSRAHCENGIVTFKRCCSAPNLDGGFVVPERSIYPHGTKLTYACDTGNKPAVEGWCATSTCQNNKWSPEPKCIDERYCLPPNIPNAKYKTNAAGWYEETKIRITCDEGYMSRDGDATAECKNGTWTSIPICEKSMDACDEPPKMPHAVIIQRHQTLFGVDSKVLYKCEDGYVVEGRDEETFIYCISGNWTASQPCRVSTSSVRDPSGTRPTVATIDKCGEVPTLANGVVTTTRVSLTYQCNNYYKLVGSAQVVCFSDGSWSNLPTCKGVSTGSVRDPSGTRPATTTIDKCGEVPTLANGVVTTTRVSLTYQCNHFYKLVGLAQVVCFSDGSWSNLPTCEDDFCLVNTAERHELQHSDVKYLKEGTGDYFNCLVTDYWNTPYYSVGQCKNGIVTFKRLSADHSQPDSLSF
ncbi:complement factor H-related protein 5-like isoform 5-T5 [Polymixia lowei]